jgi:hypothetical protein
MTKVKEQEAFRTMSAFFIHDLKNLASRLSLTWKIFRSILITRNSEMIRYR